MLRPYSAPPEGVRVHTRWARISCPPQHATDRPPLQVIDLTTHCRRHTGGLSPALEVCGHPKSQSSEASAAEVSTTRSETSTLANPTASPVTGPVSFTDGQTAFTEKRYGDAERLFTAYTSDKPDNVWGYYMLGLSAWKAGDRDAAVNAFTLALE